MFRLTRSHTPLLLLTLSGCWLLGLWLTGCGPLEVIADPTGAKLLPLSGELGVEGSLKRDLKVMGKVYEKGVQVRVFETWLIRKDRSKTPPSYRIKGLYDPATQSSGFVLPDRAVDIYAYCAVGPAYKVNIAVPLAALVKNVSKPIR